MQNKTTNIDIELKDPNLTVIEQRINNYKTGDIITGYKIRNNYGSLWLSKDQFNILFMERGDLF